MANDVFANIAANGIGGRMDELCEITPRKFDKKVYELKDTSDSPIETVKKMSTKEELFEALKERKSKYHYLISVDGGIDDNTSKLVKEAGADVIIVGTYLASNLNKEIIKVLEDGKWH